MTDPNAPGHSTVAQGLDDRARMACELKSGLPARIGRFAVLRPLGGGAFGCVYLCHDGRLNREVAIKVPRCGELTPTYRARFLREALAAATVSHANVCPIYEADADGDIPYIVMRYVSGGTLADLLARGPLSPVGAVRIAKKLALGVACAHAKGVTHRDLKPVNVLYDEANDDVLITDFGLAQLRDAGDATAEGIRGTPAYMSPEQVGDGETPGDIGPLSDVYSLGVIFFELLTGQQLFRGTPLALMLAHAQRKPDRPSARVPGLDPALDELCLKALQKNPANRYPSAKAFADALGAYLRGASGPAVDPRAEAEADFRRGWACAHSDPPDHGAARVWYEKAAAQGHAGAMFALGYLYDEGLGVPRDPGAARGWYEQAAAQGHVNAQHSLGSLYQHGRGVERDFAAARVWYAKAADQGHRGASNALAFLWANGLGGPRDESKAAELYDRAAGHSADRGSRLGCIYMDDES